MIFFVMKIKMNLRNEKYDSFALLRNAHVNKARGHIQKFMSNVKRKKRIKNCFQFILFSTLA